MDFLTANRISYEFDLKGPSITMRAACSSGGLALHMACEAIQAGRCEAAIVAGVNLILAPNVTIAMAEMAALSPDASCKTFDASANGYARGEAVNALYIKRLDSAVRDGNPIRAVIRASHANSDGRTAGIAMPSATAQEALIRAAYKAAGITDYSQTAVVECHGTGTPVGDPIEVEAISRVFGPSHRLFIGSVKPNFGHSEGASAITSIIKSIVAMERRTVLPNIKFHKPNPKIPFASTQLTVPTEPTPWPVDRRERVSLTSMGIGGANVHFILESAASALGDLGLDLPPVSIPGLGGMNPPLLLTNGTGSTTKRRKSQLLLFSAKSQPALEKAAENHRAFLGQHPDELDDLAYTLAHKREHLPLRSFGVVDGSSAPDEEWQVSPPIKASLDGRRVVFVFSGQGAQWAQMGRDLLLAEAEEAYQAFGEAIDAMDQHLAALKHAPPGWRLRDELLKPRDQSLLHLAEYAQPVCTALQVALVDLLRMTWGVSPAAVVGHSSGEIAAAYAAGALDMGQAISVAYYRGLVSARQTRSGGMVALGLGREEAVKHLVPGVVVACENSGSSVTLSGDEAALEQILATFKAERPDVLARKLVVDKAYHSHHMTEVGQEYYDLIDPLLLPPDDNNKACAVPFFSSVDPGSPVGVSVSDLCSAKYWRRNLENPVLFHSAVSKLLAETGDGCTHLEIGPHSALAGPLKQIYTSESRPSTRYTSVLVRNQGAERTFLTAMGELHSSGVRMVPIPVPTLSSGSGSTKAASKAPRLLHPRTIVDLPSYAWNKEKKYWYESRVSRDWRLRRFPPHDLLGVRILEGNELEPVWRNVLSLDNVEWIKDHRVGNDVVFPAAAFVATAGEAVRQLRFQPDGEKEDSSLSSSSYTVRNMSITTALVLSTTRTTELVTRLRPQQVTNTLTSDHWYEFVIMSLHGTTWTRHCAGLVRAGKASTAPAPAVKTYTRPVEPQRWYATMAGVGLNYGPAFAGLQDISAGVAGTKTAAASVVDRRGPHESPYALHPCTLDMVFQSLTVASVRGQPRLFRKLFLPTHIDELYIGGVSPSDQEQAIRINSRAKIGKSEVGEGHSHGVIRSSDGGADQLVFHLKALRFSPLDNDQEGSGPGGAEGNGEQGSSSHTGLMLWKPDFELLVDPSRHLVPARDARREHSLAEKLFLLCAIDTQQILREEEAAQGHAIQLAAGFLQLYRDWIDKILDQARQPGYDYPAVGTPEAQSLFSLTTQQRRDAIEAVYAELRNTFIADVGTEIYRIHRHALGIFTGAVDPLELLLRENVLAGFYNCTNDLWDYTECLQLLGHLQPNMRILEVGSGTGGLTAKLLEALVSDHGDPLYLEYTYTDVSAGFFVQAKERFRDYSGIEYRVLDISRDPLEQGFRPGQFDLIVCSNVVHATPCLRTTLGHIRTLLRPRGRLLLQEICTATKWTNYVMGTLAGWWLGAEDGRVDEPYIQPEEWNTRLLDAGFDGTSVVRLDDEAPFQVNSIIISQRVDEQQAQGGAGAVEGPQQPGIKLLSMSKTPHPLALEVERLLSNEVKSPIEVSHHIWGAPLEDQGQQEDVVAFVDLEETPLLQDITEADLEYFLHLVDQLQVKSSSILWLTRDGSIHPENPHHAQILGVGRTIRAELNSSFSTLEFARPDLEAAARCTELAGAVVSTLRKVQRGRQDALSSDVGLDMDDMDPDAEFAFVNGAVHVSRLQWISLPRALAGTPDISLLSSDHTSTPTPSKALGIARRGLLQSLHWQTRLLDDVAADQVQVRMHAVGMNFKDVVFAMGIIDGDDSHGKSLGLGCEGAGVVTKVGRDVSHVRVGDRVMGFGSYTGALATELTTLGRLTVAIPDALGFEEAATMPCVYVTVLRGLVDKAALRPGQSLLIHSAAGGVGIAALTVARWLGLKVYATVGTEDKAAYISRTFGIPREHIYSSRDETFLDGIMAATDGRGVDAVLNSLSGEQLHASWRCVAAYGTMLEIGKRDMVGHGKLDMDWFEDNRSFVAIDVSRLGRDDAEVTTRLLNMVIDLYKQGNITPIRPMTIYEAQNVEDAFRCMQKGLHVGKVVIRFPIGPGGESDDASLVTVPTVPELALRPDRTYVLVGGMGGLGCSIARWMATHGAQHIMFVSRSAGTSHSKEDEAFLRELAEMGCRVQTAACSVADREALGRAIASAEKPIAGVIQMAMVLQDTAFLQLDVPAWKTAVEPKVQGTWNLHHLLPRDLDFFVMLSSTSGVCGYWGQANYSSANAFLDAFAAYRQSLGLAASVVDIGAVAEVGYVSRNSQAMDMFKAASARLITEQGLLDCLQLTMNLSRPGARIPSPPSTAKSKVKSTPLSDLSNPSQLVTGLSCRLPMADPNNTVVWKRDPRFGLYRSRERQAGVGAAGGGQQDAAAGGALRQFLQGVAADPSSVLSSPTSAEFLAREIANRVQVFLLVGEDEPFALTQTLAGVGVDSLIAIEVRNWWKQNLGSEVSVLELLGAGSFLELGELAVERLKAKYHKPSPATS